MRTSALLLALASTAIACSPASVGGVFDAGADVPAAVDAPVVAVDVPTAVDVPIAPRDVPVTPPIDAPVVARDAPAVSPADGSVLPPRDAGPLPLDGGALGEPAWASLEVRAGDACPPLAACGGPEGGTWDVSGGCIEVPLPAQLMTCPGARVTRTSGRARGRVTFAAGFARRASQWEVEAEIFIPQLCAAFVGGCAAIADLVRPALPDSACVTAAGGDCRCAARQSGAIDDGDRYSVTASQIVSTSSGKRWDYCVAGDRLRYLDVSGVGAREPGPIELTRRAP